VSDRYKDTAGKKKGARDTQTFEKPDPAQLVKGGRGSYDKLDEDGIVCPGGCWVSSGDFLCFLLCFCASICVLTHALVILVFAGTTVVGNDIIMGKTAPIPQEPGQPDSHQMKKDCSLPVRKSLAVQCRHMPASLSDIIPVLVNAAIY
jgi:DNA-directed RNA polymerase beta subunit